MSCHRWSGSRATAARTAAGSSSPGRGQGRYRGACLLPAPERKASASGLRPNDLLRSRPSGSSHRTRHLRPSPLRRDSRTEREPSGFLTMMRHLSSTHAIGLLQVCHNLQQEISVTISARLAVARQILAAQFFLDGQQERGLIVEPPAIRIHHVLSPQGSNCRETSSGAGGQHLGDVDLPRGRCRGRLPHRPGTGCPTCPGA